MRLVRSNNGEGREVIAYARERIERLRGNLESLTCRDEDAQQTRGRIAELKALIKEIEQGSETA